MPRSFVLTFIPFLLLLAACSGPATPAATSPAENEQLPTPLVTAEPPTPAATEPAGEPSPAVTDEPEPSPSFEAAAFQDETLGIQFDYPDAWSLENLGVLGDRGSGIQFIEGGEVRMNVTVLRWDPTNDLDAFTATRQQAWSASGFEIVNEEELILPSGHQALRFVIQTPEGERALFFFTALVDRYLEINGTGDLELLAQVTETVRLRQPIDESVDSLPYHCNTVGEEEETGWVVCNVIAGIRSRNLSALHGFMADPFTIGYWGSEGYAASPAEITAELVQNRLPADPSSPLSFTAEQADFPPLHGTPPEMLFGPDLEVVQIIYSEGWGPDGRGAALLYFVRDVSGRLVWHALAYSTAHFDK
jgi:hypothetical protein